MPIIRGDAASYPTLRLPVLLASAERARAASSARGERLGQSHLLKPPRSGLRGYLSIVKPPSM